MSRHTRKPSSRARLKLAQLLLAKTAKGRANLATDLIFDEILQDPFLDEVFHLGIELGFGNAPLNRKTLSWLRKLRKYRLSR
jgi:hypothetical protein